MLLLERLGTIVFGLWLTSHGTGPGESIMIVLGLPVVLFGVMLTFIGFTKFLKEKKPDVPELGLERSSKKRDRFPGFEGTLFFADSVEREGLALEQEERLPTRQKVQERQPRRNTCPECGTKYGLIDSVCQPTICSKCWKKSKSSSVR